MNHDILQICESTAFTAKDIKAIAAARAQAAEINETINKVLADSPHAPYDVAYSWLHCEIDRLEQVLIDQPTHMRAEIFHAAIIRLEEAKLSQNRVGGALGIALAKVSQSVADIVNSLLDQVRKTIISEADKRRAELATSNHALFSNAPEKAALEARVQALIHGLNTEREEAAKCPLGWLDRAGLAMELAQAASEPELVEV